MFKYKIYILPKESIIDPESDQILNLSKKITDIDNLKLGKYIEIDSKDGNINNIKILCNNLLSNTITEQFRIIKEKIK